MPSPPVNWRAIVGRPFRDACLASRGSICEVLQNFGTDDKILGTGDFSTDHPVISPGIGSHPSRFLRHLIGTEDSEHGASRGD